MLPVAVVVPTLGRPDLAARVLTQVVDQAAPDDQVVAVDQSADADHRALVAAIPDRVLVVRRPPGLPDARNAGVAATTAPLVLFFDDDVVLSAGCLDAHRRAYVDPTVGGAVGRIRERRLRPNARRTTNRISLGGRIVTRLDRDDPAPIETLKGANMSFRRAALDAVGGFDPGYAGTSLLEDADLSVRVAAVGWRLRYLPDAAVDHLHAEVGGVRVGSRLETERWRFRNTGYFVGKHRSALAAGPPALTFAAIAVLRALEAREPSVVGALGRAWLDGWRSGRGRPS